MLLVGEGASQRGAFVRGHEKTKSGLLCVPCVSFPDKTCELADIPPGLGAGIAWANGFKCVGIFKGDDAWVQEQCKEKL